MSQESVRLDKEEPRVPKPLTGKSLVEKLMVKPGRRAHLKDALADDVHGWEKEEAVDAFAESRKRLGELQYKLYADGRFGVLVVLQATDGGGKDSTVRDVFTSMNPQGCVVTSFKAPTAEELKHDYLWRVHEHVPERGIVGVFNRSHYEDVLVVRVENLVPEDTWKRRYDHINDFERMLTDSNIRVVKFFLQISKDEQKKRMEERLSDPEKHWKFNADDLEKRKHWDAYQEAFEAMLSRCSTEHAPWYVIPSDRKWFRNLAVSEILLRELSGLPLRFPAPTYDPKKVRLR
jgi:PPK2 family polyphosphate:nucleotide phosphotransferase